MTKRIGNVVIIEPERPQQCDGCGTIAELRPYGPNFSMVCFDCGMRDPEGARQRMNHKLYDEPMPGQQEQSDV